MGRLLVADRGGLFVQWRAGRQRRLLLHQRRRRLVLERDRQVVRAAGLELDVARGRLLAHQGDDDVVHARGQLAQGHRRLAVGRAVDGDAGAGGIAGDGQRRLGLDLEQLSEPARRRRVDVVAGELALGDGVVDEALDRRRLHVEELERDDDVDLGAALLERAVDELVGAQRLARLRHAGRCLAVAAEHHLDLDQVLALHHVYACRRGGTRAQGIGELLRQGLGNVDGLDAEHRHAHLRCRRWARQKQRQRHGHYGQEIATHCSALYTKEEMRLSISAKIFVGFLVVLATFGAVATYGAITMRNLGDELRLVSRGYLDLRLQVSELYTAQTNLLKELELLSKEGPVRARLVKPDLATARRVRLMKTPRVREAVRALPALRSSAEEHALPTQARARPLRVESEYRADD